MAETILESNVQAPVWASQDESWWRPIEQMGVRAASNAGAVMDRCFGSRANGRFGLLMYHRVTTPANGLPQPTINVTPAAFRRQIVGLIDRGFHIWPLRELLQAAERGEAIPENTTALTFDDAFESFFSNAYPVLKELNVPATVFVNTAFVGQDIPLPFDHWATRHHQLLDHADFRPINWRQASELCESELVELGVHTHTHQDFRGREDEFERDLQLSVDIFRERLGVERPTFAFPYGTPHLGFAGGEMIAAAKRTGVVCGLTTGSELIEPGSDPFTWGRFNAFSWDNGDTLAAKLHGWYSWAPQRRRQFARICSTVVPSLSEHREQPAAASMTRTSSPRPAATGPRDEHSISVVVPTYNRCEWLPGALNSLCRQRTDNRFHYDIIVVDNASSDDTKNVVREIAAASPVKIEYLYQEAPGDAPTRNKGVAHGASRWLAFFDDDQFAEADWLLELHAAAVQTGAEVIGGPVHLDISEEEARRIGKIGRRTLREITFYPSLHPYVRNDLPGTGNALVDREVFESIGMFNEAMTGGGSDSDLFIRARDAGFQLWYTPRAVIRHRVSRHRLTPEYMRWDALSGGAGHAAHFDYQKKGAGYLALMCAVRMVHAATVTCPLMAWAYLRRDQGEVLGRKTMLWRAEGYARKTLAVLFPRWFGQREFFASLEFRKGREVGVV